MQQDREISDARAARRTSAMVVGADGRISSHAAADRTAIRELLAHAVAEQPPTGPAPLSRFPSRARKPVDLAGYGGHTTLLFWNPACGFRQKIFGDLQRRETRRALQAPQLLVISTGNPEANQAFGLASPVLLDAGFSTGAAFGAGRTPSGVLIDERGHIASEPMAGAATAFTFAERAVTSPALSANPAMEA